MTNLKLEVTEISQVGEARRLGVLLAQNLGFSEIEAGKVAIVASEMASNLARYTVGGEFIVRTLDYDDSARGLELLAVDKGPGMSDVAACLQDGFSTSGSAGIGLGAIVRQSDLFDVYSIPGSGTVLLSQLWVQPPRPGAYLDADRIGAVCLAAPFQSSNGDAWAIHAWGDTSRILVVDGLGHGEPAALAAQAVVRLFNEHPNLSPVEMVELAHGHLYTTRGAVMAVAEVDHARQTVRYCGVGNIAALICDGIQTHGMVSYEGIVGHTAHKISEFTYSYRGYANPLLILHSDGLGTHWTLNTYPDLRGRHPSLIAGVLYRDFKRPNDDLTVLVIRLA